MKLYDFLKEYGLNANDIKNRIISGQILVNGEPRESDYSLGNVTNVYDQGFFLEILYSLPYYDKYVNQLMFLGLPNLIGGETNIKNQLTDFLTDFKSIQISKDHIIIVKVDNSIEPKEKLDIVWDIESKKPFNREFELPKEVDDSEKIEKLLSDKEKVEKQLSNPGFIKNAPKFKIEAAQKRLGNINKQLSDLKSNLNEGRISSFTNFKY